MKNFFYVGIFVLFVVFGLTAYRQNEKAQIYRAEKNQMHKVLIQTRAELQSSKLEVSKLRQVIEAERTHTQALLKEAAKRK
jgi:hypothetical protein